MDKAGDDIRVQIAWADREVFRLSPHDRIVGAEALLRFCRESPRIRRWYVARVFDERGSGADESRAAVDLFFAEASQQFDKRLRLRDAGTAGGYPTEYLATLTKDRIVWWKDEDFDRPVHLTLKEIREVMRFHRSVPIEEGMVYLEVPDRKMPRFLHFSRQARLESRRVAKRAVVP